MQTPQDCRVLQVHADHQAPKAKRVNQAPKVNQGKQAQLVHREWQGLQELRVLPAHQDPQDPPVPLVRLHHHQTAHWHQWHK